MDRPDIAKIKALNGSVLSVMKSVMPNGDHELCESVDKLIGWSEHLERRVEELESRKDRHRSNSEVVADCNALAVKFAELDGWVPSDTHRLRMHTSKNPRGIAWWHRAVVACELIRNDCVGTALASVIAGKAGDASHG